MRGNRACLLAILMCLATLPMAAQGRSKAKARPAADAKAAAAQVKALREKVEALTAERDELKTSLDAAMNKEESGAVADRSRQMAMEEVERLKRELASLKANLADNQKGSEELIRERSEAQKALAQAQTRTEGLEKELEAAKAKLQAGGEEGALVPLSPEVTPAVALNILRVTPSFRKVSRGVIVVNVLVSEKGEVLDARLLQPLPGEGEWVKKANESCVEAAKKLVFDPARSTDGKTRFKVWQGVGFLVD